MVSSFKMDPITIPLSWKHFNTAQCYATSVEFVSLPKNYKSTTDHGNHYHLPCCHFTVRLNGILSLIKETSAALVALEQVNNAGPQTVHKGNFTKGELENACSKLLQGIKNSKTFRKSTAVRGHYRFVIEQEQEMITSDLFVPRLSDRNAGHLKCSLLKESLLEARKTLTPEEINELEQQLDGSYTRDNPTLEKESKKEEENEESSSPEVNNSTLPVENPSQTVEIPKQPSPKNEHHHITFNQSTHTFHSSNPSFVHLNFPSYFSIYPFLEDTGLLVAKEHQFPFYFKIEQGNRVWQSTPFFLQMEEERPISPFSTLKETTNNSCYPYPPLGDTSSPYKESDPHKTARSPSPGIATTNSYPIWPSPWGYPYGSEQHSELQRRITSLEMTNNSHLSPYFSEDFPIRVSHITAESPQRPLTPLDLTIDTQGKDLDSIGIGE